MVSSVILCILGRNSICCSICSGSFPEKTEDNLSQSIFWKLYSQVSNIDEIKTVNRNYLFTRVMIVEFLLISILLFLNDNNFLGIISFFISIIFLWRSRGLARGLVLKTVILNLKKE